MNKTTRKSIRDFVKYGIAVDISDYDFDAMNRLLKGNRLAKVCYSTGIYGINAGVLENIDTGEMYAITARNCALSMAF